MGFFTIKPWFLKKIIHQVKISLEDEKILEQFHINIDGFDDEVNDLAEKLQEKIEENLESKKQDDIKENILNDPSVKMVYSE